MYHVPCPSNCPYKCAQQTYKIDNLKVYVVASMVNLFSLNTLVLHLLAIWSLS